MRVYWETKALDRKTGLVWGMTGSGGTLMGGRSEVLGGCGMRRGGRRGPGIDGCVFLFLRV